MDQTINFTVRLCQAPCILPVQDKLSGYGIATIARGFILPITIGDDSGGMGVI